MAGNIQGITIQIGADTTKLSSAMYAANKSIKETEKDLRSVEKALKIDPTNINLWKDKQDLLNKEIGDTEKKLDALKKAQAQLDADNVDKNSQEYKDLQREINLCETELKGLNDQAKELGSAGAQSVAAMGESVKEVGTKISDVGESLTQKVTLPLVAAGTVGAAKFAEVDKTMQLTNATMKNSAEEAELLNKAMKEAAANSTFGMSDAATATLNFARAGLDATQAAAALAPAMNLAAGEGGDLDVVSGGLVATINGFHGSFDEAAKYADVFASACNNSALDVNSLSEAMSVASPIFSSAGYSVEDAALYMGVMANNGIEASKAANSLKTGLARLAAPAKEGEEAMDALGFTITKLNKDHTGIEMKTTLEIQRELHEAFSQMSESEQLAAASAIFGKNQMAPWLALINTAPDDVEALNAALRDCSGTTDEMAKAMMSGFGGSLESLKSSIDVAATSIGEALAPTILKVSDAIQKAVDWFNALSSEQQSMAATIGIVVAAIGPLLVIVGKLVTGIGQIMTMAPQISSAITALTGPLGIAIVAIAAVVTAIATLWNTNEDFRDNIIAMWNKLKDSFSKFTEKIQSALEKLGLDFGDTSGSIMGIWTALCDFLAPIFEGAFSGIITFLEGAMDSIAGIIEIATGIISGDWATAWQGIVDLAVGIFNTLTAPIQAVLDAIARYFGTDLDTIKKDVLGAFNQIKSDITEKFGQARDKVQEILGNIKNFFTNDLKAAYDTVVDKMGSIKTSIQTKLGEARDKASEILEKIKGFFKDKMESAKTEVQTRIDAIANFFPTKLNEILGNVNDIMSNIKKAFTDKIQQAHDAIKGIIDKIKSLFNISLKLDMKLPHITLKGGEPPYGIGGEGSLPSFSVKWYDKGGIFDHPSIIGVGEKRPEFVGALDDLRQIVREESGAGATDQLLLQMVQLMGQLVEQGSRPITVNQTINANETSYAEQQRAAAYEFKQIARALT